MESKTLSKADQLKGLVDLRDNPFNQFIEAACEHEVQQLLNVLLDVTFASLPDSSTKAISFLGEMRGLRSPGRMLRETIDGLSKEVLVEKDPVSNEQNKQQEPEV